VKVKSVGQSTVDFSTRRFITPKELAVITGISPGTWSKHRMLGTGPPYYRFCGRIHYDLPETLDWIRKRGSNGGRAA
jgi:hypothetical protein